ncbi:MAG TPA: S53 family peptidase, partial [Caulobacteraceae bacterium]|nr:S53 family peptidase [Caulobacteraceae bacterium]
MALRPLLGSERTPLSGARDTGAADPNERVEASVLVRRRKAVDLTARVGRLRQGDKSVGHMNRDRFAAEYGADPADMAAVARFAAAHGLTVASQDPARRTLVLSGTVAQFNQAFAVDLRRFQHAGGAYRGRVGAIHIPEELEGVVIAVLGLDNRPQARPHMRLRRSARAAPATSFTPIQLAALYGFPDGDGAGECIAIVELGGGYKQDDLNAYFTALGVSPAPSVVAVPVDQARNAPTGDPNGPDGEVMLDIEVVGSIAPKARIAVYFAPNTDAGFVDAITTAAHDQTNKPSIISISWGGPESSWTDQAMTALDEALQAAAAMGVSVCVASGDSGSSDGVDDGADHVDFPASSPHALACGGTSLKASGSSISSETVWNDGAQGGASGGGVSVAFDLPAWQEGLSATLAAGGATPLAMRGVPDVCGDADPETGYDVRIDGTDAVIGGTSAVAP